MEFLYAALNNLDIFPYYISNAYLESPCGEKLWTVTAEEFGILDGTLMQINRSFYGIKYAGNSWHKALSTTLSNTNFEPIREDPDIWLKMSTTSRLDR